jgi:MFS family permease
MGERVATKHLSTSTGIGMMGFYFGSALGPWLGGFIFDVKSSYLWAFILAIVVSIMALIIDLRMHSARREITDNS